MTVSTYYVITFGKLKSYSVAENLLASRWPRW